jgi:hypothetical protein
MGHEEVQCGSWWTEEVGAVARSRLLNYGPPDVAALDMTVVEARGGVI